jgi:hypothetical protein
MPDVVRHPFDQGLSRTATTVPAEAGHHRLGQSAISNWQSTISMGLKGHGFAHKL